MNRREERRPRLNNQIRVPQVNVIDFDGKNLGIMQTHEALKKADERGLDLVEVGPNAAPPIAKIIDYGRYIYQKEKHTKPVKSTSQEIKTVKIGLRTEIHDLNTRAGQADKFLGKDYRVKVELTLRGREKSMAKLGREKLEKFLQLISRPFVIEDEIRRSPIGLSVLIRTDKKKGKQ